jgi:UDP:flavonoid glycosyltransferase YjiC (YdhE family)
MADDLIDLVGDWRPHVIVRESVEFAGSVVAEREGIPFATFDFSFPHDLAYLTSTLGGGPREGLDELRRHVGLDGASTPDWFTGGLRICTLPEAYLGRAHRRATEVAIRPNVLEVADDVAVPGWVSELEDAVYVSFGTVFPKWFPDILELAVAGTADFDAPTVVTHGPSIDAEALNLPESGNVRLARYVPQGPVLDRCAAAVTHGGTGTVLGALARGVPVVVIPLGADQHTHAAAIRRLGAGVVLDWRDLTAERVTAAVREIVTDRSYAETAKGFAQELAALPGPAVAAEALERLAIVGR